MKHLTGIRRDHQLISRPEGIRHGIWHDGDPVPSIQQWKSARDRGDTSRIIDADGEWIVHGIRHDVPRVPRVPGPTGTLPRQTSCQKLPIYEGATLAA